MKKAKVFGGKKSVPFNAPKHGQSRQFFEKELAPDWSYIRSRSHWSRTVASFYNRCYVFKTLSFVESLEFDM